MSDNINAHGYVIIKVANHKDATHVHPVMMTVLSEEDKFNTLPEAWADRSKRENPEDYIILPYW